MSFVKWMCILLSALFVVQPVVAQDHQVGFTGGLASMYGDNTNSDAGASLGLNYERIFNPLISAGVEGIYQRLSGESWIHDSTSIFQGLHKYDTSFLMMGLFNRLKAPTRIVQPSQPTGATGSRISPPSFQS